MKFEGLGSSESEEHMRFEDDGNPNVGASEGTSRSGSEATGYSRPAESWPSDAPDPQLQQFEDDGAPPIDGPQ